MTLSSWQGLHNGRKPFRYTQLGHIQVGPIAAFSAALACESNGLGFYCLNGSGLSYLTWTGTNMSRTTVGGYSVGCKLLRWCSTCTYTWRRPWHMVCTQRFYDGMHTALLRLSWAPRPGGHPQQNISAEGLPGLVVWPYCMKVFDHYQHKPRVAPTLKLHRHICSINCHTTNSAVQLTKVLVASRNGHQA